jgi:methenyltetrahydrofolate cyclohydrolase
MRHRRISSNTSVRDLLAALSAAEAAHGAVSASAVAAGMGTSLLLMVAALPKTRSGTIDDRTALTGVATALIDVRKQLAEAMDAELTAGMVAARKMPQATETQRAEREAAIQLALRTAADVPLEVMRLSALGLKHAQTVAARGCRAASSDVELAVALLRVGLTGARSNLELKLGSLTDAEYTEAVVDQIARLSDEGTRAADAADSLLRVPPA